MSIRCLIALAALPMLTAATLPKDKPERAADASDKMICKRFIRTGSLVDGYRVCKTKADWQRERDSFTRRLTVGDSCRSRGEPNPLLAGGGCSL
jgi:hypothetical protein